MHLELVEHSAIRRDGVRAEARTANSVNQSRYVEPIMIPGYARKLLNTGALTEPIARMLFAVNPELPAIVGDQPGIDICEVQTVCEIAF